MATMQFSYTVCIFGPHTQFFFYCSFNSYLFSILIGHYSLLRTGNRAARPLGMNNLQSFFRCSTFFCNDIKTSHLSSILNCMWCFIILYPVYSLLSNAIFCCFIIVLLQPSTSISPLSISHIHSLPPFLSLSLPSSFSQLMRNGPYSPYYVLILIQPMSIQLASILMILIITVF